MIAFLLVLEIVLQTQVDSEYNYLVQAQTVVFLFTYYERVGSFVSQLPVAIQRRSRVVNNISHLHIYVVCVR